MNHRITTKIQRRIYGHATDVAIRPLDEQKAVQAATDLIGEGFIFSVLLLNAITHHVCVLCHLMTPFLCYDGNRLLSLL
jgi:hypothetical protein